MNISFIPETAPNQPVDTNQLPKADRLLNAYEVAERLGISRALTYNLLQSGEIPTVRFRGTVRVKANDLETFIEQHTFDPFTP